MRRRLNKRLVAILVVAGAMLGAGIHVLHGFQVQRSAQVLLKLSDEAAADGDLARAAQHLDRYLAYRPDDGEALVKYALMLETLAQTRPAREQALKVLQKAVRARPERADVRRKTVRVALELGRFADAREHLDVLMKAEPDDGELEQFAGQCAVGTKKDAEAAAWFQKAIEHAPQRVEGYVLLAGLLRVRLNDPERADRVMDQMVAANGESPRAHLERWRYRVLFRPPADVKDIERALQLAPDDADALLAAAEAAQLGGDFEQARTHLKHGLGRHPQDVRLHRALAGVELRARRPAEAVAGLERAIEAVPAETSALRLDLAETLIRADRPEEASKVITELRQAQRPASPLLDLLEARTRMAREDTAGAIRLLETARSILTTQAVATATADRARRQLLVQTNLLLGQCYERAGAADVALAAYQRVLEIEPQSLPGQVGVAATLAASGRIDSALQGYEKVAAEVPESRIIVARLALLKALRAPADQRRWAEVERVLDRAAQVAPDSIEVPLYRVEMLAAQNQLDRARTLLEEIRGRHPDRPEPWVALAVLAERQRGTDAALALLEEARGRLGDRAELRLARANTEARRGGAAALQAIGREADGLEKFAAADQARLLDGLAGAFAQAGDIRQATQFWERLAQLRPNDPGVRALLFDLALQAGDAAAQERTLKELRAIEGEDGSLWRFGEAARLVAQAVKGDKQGLDRARARLAEVARLRPNWPRVALLQAEIAELEGDQERAIEGYQRAIDQGESGTKAVRQLVQLLYRRGRYAEADRALRRLPEQVPLSGMLGQIAAELSLRDKNFGRALELAQQSVPADSANYRDRVWLAQVQAASGKSEEALATLRRASQVAGDEPAVWIALVRQLALLDRKADAEAAIQEAQAKLPPETAPLALAYCHELIGAWPRAEALYQDLLAARPDDATTRVRAAAFYLRILRPREAEPHLRRILEPDLKAPADDVAAARRNLAIILADRGTYRQFQEALELVESNLRVGGTTDDLRTKATVLASRPDRRRDAIATFEELDRRGALTPNDQFLLARLYGDDGNWPKARALLRTLLAAYGEEPTYLATFIARLIERGNAAEADPFLEQLERLEPKAYRTKELRARLLKARGQDDAAVALLKACLREEGMPVSRIALMLEGWGRDADAEAAYRAAADRPGPPEEVLLLATFLGRKGRVGEALDLCDRALKTCPPDLVGAAYLSVLGEAPSDETAIRRVDRALDGAIRAHPDSRMLPVHRAVLRTRQGLYDEAEAIYRRLIQQDGRHVAALNNLALLLAQRGRGGEEALRLVDRAIALAGPQAALLDTRAVACLALGRPDDAIRDLERALAQVSDGNGYFHLARAYQQADKRDAAAEAFRKARSLNVRPDPLERPAYDRLVTLLGPN